MNISAQNSLAKITLLGASNDNEDDTTEIELASQRLVDSKIERNAKSIGGTIANSQM